MAAPCHEQGSSVMAAAAAAAAVTPEGKRRISTCSGYSTATGELSFPFHLLYISIFDVTQQNLVT